MSQYGAFSDDFYVNMILATEMELPTNRESVLHYFEQVRRRFPQMQNFYAREKGEYVLEEEKAEDSSYRWTSVEPKRVNSGVVNPESFEAAVAQHAHILDLVPYDLSITPLDCESLSVMLGFDFNYQGNHNEILADVVGVPSRLELFSQTPYGKLLSFEPSIQFSLDEECRTQCRISFESRTTAYQVRKGEFGEDAISVYLTVRRYDSLDPSESYAKEFKRLAALSCDLVDEHLVSGILRPLQEAISAR
ncbi:hypothetical protein N9N28_15295 [Rubripirellula amarantea]|uniref:TIGR04255 family protein n=1 Tax=Rubripirellula amarantea TaxID=2527999 RepID=A0A5C5WIV2_9BACT|nr:hypothetical protein [Rubripirellula amarantea]MDA8745990.1 hypothetical protein [Rubripirellula amarantea]TWT50497.1 hypothetical protein Pla22_32400 [Rubripirellula amarantea]